MRWGSAVSYFLFWSLSGVLYGFSLQILLVLEQTCIYIFSVQILYMEKDLKKPPGAKSAVFMGNKECSFLMSVFPEPGLGRASPAVTSESHTCKPWGLHPLHCQCPYALPAEIPRNSRAPD